MANWQAVNINTGAVEGKKYFQIGTITEMWKATLTTALANGDTILGPTLPAGLWLSNIKVAATSLDSSTGLTFEIGYTGALGAFATGSTVGQGGGIQSATLPATAGFTAATDTQILITITHAATTPVAGTMVIEVTYLANP
jgi:hypothetical protein